MIFDQKYCDECRKAVDPPKYVCDMCKRVLKAIDHGYYEILISCIDCGKPLSCRNRNQRKVKVRCDACKNKKLET